MAGLWDRVSKDAPDKISIHLIVALLELYHVNTFDPTKGATLPQLLTKLNAVLAADGNLALQALDITDITNITVAHDAQTNLNNKQTYILLLDGLLVAAEKGAISEANFRSDLGIV